MKAQPKATKNNSLVRKTQMIWHTQSFPGSGLPIISNFHSALKIMHALASY